MYAKEVFNCYLDPMVEVRLAVVHVVSIVLKLGLVPPAQVCTVCRSVLCTLCTYMCAYTVRMYIHNMHTYVCAYVANHGFVDIRMYIQYVPYVLHMHVYICHVLVSYSSLTTFMTTCTHVCSASLG